MIDLHCHLLPGVDDGPQTLAEALALGRAAVADGIRHAVLTPHVALCGYANTRSSVSAQVDAYRAALSSHGIPLAVGIGGEIRISAEVLDLLDEDELPFLGARNGYRVALFELPHQFIPAGSHRFFSGMIERRIQPIIAHPERNGSVVASPDSIRPFVDMGCLTQLTAASILGHFGEGPKKAAEHLLENDLAWVVASDAHNLTDRPPAMGQARAALRERFGARLVQLLFTERPAEILGLSHAALT